MFPPHLIIHGLTFKTVYLFIVVPGLIGGYNYFAKHKRTILEKSTLQFMFLGLVYMSIVSLTVLFKDISVIGQILMGVIIMFACSFYVNAYYKLYGENYLIRLFKHLNIACIINSIFVIATFLSPQFKEFLYSFIGITATAKRYLFGDVTVVRYQGIVPSGFSFLSTTHALLLVIGIWGFYMDKRKYNLLEIIIFLAGQIIIFIAILLIGRTGLIIILLFLIALLFYWINSVIHNYRISKKSVKLISLFIVVAVVGIMTVNFSKYKKNIDFAFELVINLTEKRTLDRSTAEVIKQHFIFPKKTVNLLFGTGNFGRSPGLPYVSSDVGYALFINGAGIIGMLIGFAFYFPGLYYSHKYRRLNPYLVWLITVFLFALIILNLKDYYYISQVGYSQIYFILICILGIEIRQDKISINQ
jgi:hypothetical protein